MNTNAITTITDPKNEVHSIINALINLDPSRRYSRIHLDENALAAMDSPNVLPSVIPQVYHNPAMAKKAAPAKGKANSKAGNKEFTERETPEGEVTHFPLDEARSKYLQMVRTHTGCKHARRAWITDVYQVKTAENLAEVFAVILTSHEVKRTIHLETVDSTTAAEK